MTTQTRTIKASAIKACPYLILGAEHYLAGTDGCRCTDPSHTDMADWGYVCRGAWKVDRS